MDDISGMFARADIAYDRVQHIKEVLDDPQALENMYIVPMANKDGTVTKQPATPIRFALASPPASRTSPPPWTVRPHGRRALGRDPREYGYSDADIERFRPTRSSPSKSCKFPLLCSAGFHGTTLTCAPRPIRLM